MSSSNFGRTMSNADLGHLIRKGVKCHFCALVSFKNHVGVVQVVWNLLVMVSDDLFHDFID